MTLGKNIQNNSNFRRDLIKRLKLYFDICAAKKIYRLEK